MSSVTSINAQNKEIELQLRGVSKLAFVDYMYNATVYLMEGAKMKTGVSVMLEVELLHDDGTSASATVLHLESKNLHIGKPFPHLQLSYRFKETSLLHSNRKFRLQVRPKGNYPGLQPVMSEPISVIKYKLEINNLLPEEFFKDQGGRDKRMQLQVQVTDARGKPVRLSKCMPLVINLCYEDSRGPVPNQREILKIMSKSTPKIGTNGKAQILFRIEEVSSRHRRKKFILCIAPDVERCPLNGDVLEVYSSGVTVRSKQTGKICKKRSRKPKLPPAGISPDIGKSFEEALAASKRQRVARSNPKQSIDNLIKWATYTCDVLRSIQCQPIGYGLNRDGSPDLNMQIYRCPACYQSSSGLANKHTSDCTLQKILTMYNESVGPGIADIMQTESVAPPSADLTHAGSVGPEIADIIESKTAGHPAAMDCEESGDDQDSVPSPRATAPPSDGGNFNNGHGLDQLRIDLNNSLGFGEATFQASPLSGDSGPVPAFYERASSLHEMFAGTHPPLVDIESPRFQECEHMVHYVYTKNVHNGVTILGFPAFDKAGNLKGFLQENANALYEPVIYLALSSLSLHASKVREVEKEFTDAMPLPNSKQCIKCLDDYESLSEMKKGMAPFLSTHLEI